MAQDRLESLISVSVEEGIPEKLNIRDYADKFVEKNVARKSFVFFIKHYITVRRYFNKVHIIHIANKLL